jgi:hypothetical protein
MPVTQRDVNITDIESGEILEASIESIVLSSDHGKVTAIMVAVFKSQSYSTLLDWLESLKSKTRKRK